MRLGDQGMRGPWQIERGWRWAERSRRAFCEFLAVPFLIVLAFLASAVLVDRVGHSAGDVADGAPMRRFLGRYAGDTQSAITILTAIAGSLVTVASHTFSILLPAVQQGATALTSQVVEHDLRRPSNDRASSFTSSRVPVHISTRSSGSGV